MTEHTQYTAESLAALSDAAFTRVVAELDGYHSEEHPDNEWANWWHIIDPQGRHCDNGHGWGYLRYEDEAWKHSVPDYAHDLNAAWSLSFADECTVDLLRVGNATLFARIVRTASDCVEIDTVHTMRDIGPARALSTAWLLWKQSVEERTP